MNKNYTQLILDYWLPKNNSIDEYNKLFVQNINYDQQIKNKFGKIFTEMENGKGYNCLLNKDSFVAYIILMNQFPKYIYRNEKNAYQYDSGTLIFAEMGINVYLYELTIPELICVLLPYLYSEIYIYQKKAIDIYNEILYELNMKNRNNKNIIYKFHNLKKEDYYLLENLSDLIFNNYRIIREFNRFPERNIILERQSTPKEIEYLHHR